MTRRILHIIPTLDRCGAEKQLVLLATGLDRERFDVHVCVLTRDGPLRGVLEEAEIPVTVIGKRWKADPVAYLRLRRHIRRLSPDLVHTWLFAANAYGRAAAHSVGIRRIIAGERCVDPWKSWELLIDRHQARYTTRLVTNSTGVRDFYAARGIAPERFEVIPNAVPPGVEPTASRSEVLRDLGLPEDAFVVGILARLWPQKRLKDAIWAADLVKVVRDDVHFLLFGGGPERDRLIRFRDNTQIQDRFHFLGERSDVARFLPHFDLLLSTSAYEGQSNAILEAMAAGVPVVASDIAGNRDLVVPDQTGILVPVENVDTRRRRNTFAKRIVQLLESPSTRQAMGQAAQRRIAEEFSVPRMIERYTDLYTSLLEGD